MTLAWWLAILIAVLFAVRVFDAKRRSDRSAKLSDLARAARMNYSPIDRFDLERRLQHSPAWTSGLTVCDVLYGTRADERVFVATLKRRASGDDESYTFVVACTEPLDHRELRLLSVPWRVRGGREWLAAYDAALTIVAH